MRRPNLHPGYPSTEQRVQKNLLLFHRHQKAYDTVWRKGLWKCLWDKGIRGKMWRVLKDFYRATRCKIRVGKGLTEEFSVEKGVKQGAVLSPILFSIFINTLVEKLGD